MSDTDGSPQGADRHHCRSCSRSPVSPGYAGETLVEREERRLAEAALPVGPPAEQPQSPPNDSKPPRRLCRPGRPPSPLRPRPLLPRPRGRPRMRKELRPRPRLPAPRPLARCFREGRAPCGRLARNRHSCSRGQERRQVPRPQPHPQQPPQAVPAQGRLPSGETTARPRPGARVYAARHHAAAAAARRQEEGDGEQAGQGTARGNAWRGAAGDRGCARNVRREQARAPTAMRGGKDTGRAQGPAAAREDRHRGRAKARAADEGRQGTVQDTGKCTGRTQARAAAPGDRRKGTGRAPRPAAAGGGQAHGAGQGTGSGRRGAGHDRRHRQGDGKDTGASGKSQGRG